MGILNDMAGRDISGLKRKEEMEKIAVEDLFDLNEIIGMVELSSGILDLKRLDVSGVDNMGGLFSGMKLDMLDIRGAGYRRGEEYVTYVRGGGNRKSSRTGESGHVYG